MKVEILSEKCIGCGKCAYFCPDGIAMENGLAVVKNPDAEGMEKAAEACPVGIIKVEGLDLPQGGGNQRLFSGNKIGQGRMGDGRGMGLGMGKGKGMGRQNGNGRGCRNR